MGKKTKKVNQAGLLAIGFAMQALRWIPARARAVLDALVSGAMWTPDVTDRDMIAEALAEALDEGVPVHGLVERILTLQSGQRVHVRITSDTDLDVEASERADAGPRCPICKETDGKHTLHCPRSIAAPPPAVDQKMDEGGSSTVVEAVRVPRAFVSLSATARAAVERNEAERAAMIERNRTGAHPGPTPTKRARTKYDIEATELAARSALCPICGQVGKHAAQCPHWAAQAPAAEGPTAAADDPPPAVVDASRVEHAVPVSVARARRIRRRNIRNDKEAIEQKAIHENVTFGKISAETLARHAVLEASLAEVQAEIDAETASTPKIDVARGDDAGASLEITPGGEIIVDGRSAGRIPSRSDPFLTGDPIVDGVRWPGPDTVLLPEDREKLSEAHAREIARQDASRCGVCGKPVSLLADCIGERVDGTFTVYHRVCREPKQGTLEGGAGAVRTTEQFAEAADYHPTHAPGEQGGRPDVKDAIAVPDQTGRRDVHGGVPLSEHTACPDLAHCDCECSVCKRAWEDAGRPKPDAGEPDDGAPGTDGYNSFGNGE